MRRPRPEWSILVATIPTRIHTRCAELVRDLEREIAGRPIEVIALYDNYHRTVGQKRTALLRLAQGRYVSFVDDDDELLNRYVEAIWETIVGQPPGDLADVIVFKQLATINDGPPTYCQYGLGMEYQQVGDQWRGLPAHTMVWRTALVQDVAFPEADFGEDVGWVRQAATRAHTELRIDETLYHYHFDVAVSETRGPSAVPV